MTKPQLRLNKELIEGFQLTFLSKDLDELVDTPDCHREWWEMFCSKARMVAIAAPRGHAKTTSLTKTCTLASICFRFARHVLIISDTETQARDFLGDIKAQILDNEDIRAYFQIAETVKDAETEFVFRFKDGEWCRLIAKGSGQKLRGINYRNHRPDLVMCHEKGTLINADGEWMVNDEHPTATHLKSPGFKITFEDGTVEKISINHRYWVKGYGWMWATELLPGMEVGEEGDQWKNCVPPIENGMQLTVPDTVKKLGSGIRFGWSIILKRTLSIKASGMLKTELLLMRTLRNMLKLTQNGRLPAVLRAAQERSKLRLRGRIMDILNCSTMRRAENRKELAVRL